MPKPELAEYYRFRAQLVERLRGELLGPAGGADEVLSDPPVTAYSTGVLFPRRKDEEQRREDAQEADVDLLTAAYAFDEQPDTGVSLANTQFPMSVGLTFAVDASIAPTIDVTVTAAVYEPVDADGHPVAARRAERRSLNSVDIRWRRVEPDLQPVSLDVTSPGTPRVSLSEGLELRARIRSQVDGATAVTVTLVNMHEVGRNDLRDAHCFFQVSLTITAPGQAAPFVERRTGGGSGDGEMLLSRLLYRHAPVFAAGHGCAAHWDWTPPSPTGQARSPERAAVSAVRTEFAPTSDTLLTESNPEIDTHGLGMHRFGTQDKGTTLTALRDLLAGYRRWIEQRAEDAEWLRHCEYGGIALEQIELCRQALSRMRSGIDLLERDELAFEAFRLANLAMARQRSRTQWIKDGRTGQPVEDGEWRPFQIGFILLSLDGIADAGHVDRQTADVLWFPTGGGKTEAYLGLIAFTVFLRRLRHRELGAGVTVIMRYTLRLLTLQQFERAATLLCAMEVIRRGDSALGEDPMSIGMWVGKAATPNRLKDAVASIASLRNGDELQEENPVQLRACPWCGTPMDAFDYDVDETLTTMTICCRNQACDFHEGLPVHVVDQALYSVRPTLVIATADKFAQIAWRDQVAGLFNRSGALDGTPPPELVIQDELHLISGPLGTLAGLYECAIDLVANRPKVIASTATIRRAVKQGGALFDRRIVQFPPSGLDARDSWFSIEAPAARKASRMYLGLMTPGTSQATLLVRAYAALLHYAYKLDGSDAVRDPYWTLVGYFNSLRLLAAAELQVQDDVYRSLELLAGRGGLKPRRLDLTSELTSRVKSSEIPKRLKDLEREIGDDPFDAVLATNMISVGVDVDRLGLMAVTGQPQMTAEYIQATSRIGRKYPGLAVVLYNASRSRDRSHYEHFTAYHSALYRQVEATSVTPFSSRARDRALHAAFVGAVRMLVPAARANSSAQSVEYFLEDLHGLRDRFIERVERIDPTEADATREELDSFIEAWRALAKANSGLVYEAEARTQFRPARRLPDKALLRSYSDDDLTEARHTLWSLRDVDAEADLYLEN